MNEDKVPSRLRVKKGFTLRIALPLIVMIALSIGLVLGFVILSASSQNRLEIASTTKLAETALSVNKRHIARNLRDYAVWEDAYRNLHESLNIEWASTDGNVGANIFEGLNYEMAFVLNPAGKSVYAVIDGIPQSADANTYLPSGLPDLAAAGAASDAPVVALLAAGPNIFLVATRAILPPSVDPKDLLIAERSVLVFAKKLDSEFLDRMSGEYLLDDLAIRPMNAPIKGASVPLLDANGKPLAALVWQPTRPGSELLRLVLPPLGLCLIVMTGFAWAMVRNTLKSTDAMEQSARTVEAYAQTLQESEARFRDVAEASSDWIWECDPHLHFIYFSDRFSEVTGLAAARMLGKNLNNFFTAEEKGQGADLLRGELVSSFNNLRCSYFDATGCLRVCRLAGRPIVDVAGTFIGYRGTATDITEEVDAQARAEHLALHDALTGLPNRVLFRERLELVVNGPRRGDGSVALLCLDLDHFKEVNDTLGHCAGDVLLKELARRLNGCVRAGDTVARLGGDEFAIIQVGLKSLEESSVLGERIIEAVRVPFHVDGQELHVGVSIGITFPAEAENDVEKLMKSSDIAMYRAKQAGRGTVRFFESQMDKELTERKSLEGELRQAMLREELDIHYQPVFDLASKRISGVEALIRWRHSDRGMIPPAAFIPIAEDTGMIIALDTYVLRKACTQAVQWPGVRMAVNLSPLHFRHRDLLTTVRAILRDTGLEAHRLELEITESVLINETESALQTLTALKALGISIAMDDFGTGYSSLSYLNAFPFDKIKIDRSFISNIDDTNKSSAIVRSVINLGQSLDMVITAEGVETEAQMQFLENEGCDQVQGYFISPAVPSENISDLLYRSVPAGLAIDATAA